MRTTAVTAQVFLTGEAAGLAAYARAVSDPADPRCGRFLAPDSAHRHGSGASAGPAGRVSLSSASRQPLVSIRWRPASLDVPDGPDHIRLDLARLRFLAEAASAGPGWTDRWHRMIAYARAQGWISPDGGSVRAHLERDAAPAG